MKFVTLDVESTGLSPTFHELTEISILNNETLELVSWDIKIRHPERCSKEALMITQKTAKELMSRGRYIEECIPEVDEFLKSISRDPDDIVSIAHNANFDRNQLETKWKENNKVWLANYWLDTMQMSKRFTKQILGIQKTSHALSNMIKLAGINEIPGAHASLVDVKNTFALYLHMQQRGLKNTEFIKLSSTLMNDLTGKKTITKQSKKIDDKEISNVMESLDSNDLSDSFQPDDEDD